MKKRKNLNKKGISVIIGYVILITISIALSILVYQRLDSLFDKDPPLKCDEEVTLSIRNVYCNATEFNLTFDIKNAGKFGVDGFEIKLNDNEGSNIGLFTIELDNTKLSPGETLHKEYDYFNDVNDGKYSSDLKLLEIQPFITKEGKNLNCQSTITDLECNN